MVQQGSDLFGRIKAGSSGSLHHDARVLQNLLFGTLFQLATNDVCSPEEAQYENRNKNEIEEDQKFENPHKELRLSANNQNDTSVIRTVLSPRVRTLQW